MSRRITHRERRQAKANQHRIGIVAISAGIIVLIFFAIISLGSNRPSVSESADSEIIVVGQRIYEQSCAACHGLQGEGHAAMAEAPALDETEHAWHHPDGQLQQIIINGGQNMPAFGDQLSNDEIVAVVHYFQTWWQPDQLAAQQGQSEGFPFQ